MWKTSMRTMGVAAGLMLGLSGAMSRAADFDKYGADDTQPANQAQKPQAAPYDEKVVAAANSHYAAAASVVDHMYLTLNIVPRQMRQRFEKSADYKAAIAEQNAAAVALQSARQVVLDQLARDPGYASLKENFDRYARILEAGHLQKQERLEVSSQKLSYGIDMHKMEADAFNADAAVQAAKTRLEAAGAKMDSLEDAFAQSVDQNPDIVATRKVLGSAQVELAAAAGYLNGLLWARQDALNAFYSQQYYNYQALYTPAYLSSPYYLYPGYYPYASTYLSVGH